MMCIFDELDEYYRYPGGAVKTPGTVRLRIKLKLGCGTGVSVLYGYDGGETRNEKMRFLGITGAYEIYEYEITLAKPGLIWYHFEICAGNGAVSVAPNTQEGSGSFGYQITAYESCDNPPDWIGGGIIYHIFVDRFRRAGEPYIKPGAIFRDDWGGCPRYLPDANGIVHNNDFFGGDFDGIIEKLPYLSELGVTCIYLSPIFEAASNHKYDIGDFMKADAAFGGDEAFERLCGCAKNSGIKIILDGVFNHVGVDSRYFNKYGSYDSVGAYQSRQSPYYGWFNFHEWNSRYDSWWGIDLLPATNKLSEDYSDFICGENGVIAHWTKKGVAGWRLDVVDELPDVFLDRLCQSIRRENEQALIVGEVWEDASNKISYGVRRKYLHGGQLDSVTNYPLRDAIIACVKEKNVRRLAETMSAICQNYPENVLNSLMNIIGTHDTMRILTVLGGKDFPETKSGMEFYCLTDGEREEGKRLLRLASVLQFTLPGVPCVYYGDEVGMEGGSDPFNRRCYPWGKEDKELISWYAQLAQLRKNHVSLKNGRYELLRAHDGVFSFARGHGAERLCVVVNVSDEDFMPEAGKEFYNFLSNKCEKILGAGMAAIYTITDKAAQ